MPRLIIDYTKCQGFRKAISIQLNGAISATLQPNTSYDKIIFTGENELVIFCGRTKSDLIKFSISERETIVLKCQTLGHFKKDILITKIHQKPATRRFTSGSHNNDHKTDDRYEISHSWREVLGVSDEATKDEIRSSYIELMKKHHPDKLLQLSSQKRHDAELMAIEINKAYNYAKRYLKI